MVWMVILYVIAGLVGLTILLCLLILFTPFYLEAKLRWGGKNGIATASFWWIHPLLLSIKYDSVKKDLTTKIAKWEIKKKEKKEPEEDVKIPESPFVETEAKPKSREDKPVEALKTIKNEEKTYDTAETVEKKTGKIDNLIDRIKKNKFLFFMRQSKWRGKIFSWLIRFIKSFGNIIHFNFLTAFIRAGIEDPAILGKIYGYYEAISNGIDNKNSECKLIFEPVFMQNCFEGNGEVRVSSSVGNLLMPFVRAIITFPYLSTFFLWLRLRRLDKKLKAEKK